MSEETPLSTQNSALREDEETSLLDFLIVLAKHKKLVLCLPLGAAIVAAIVSVLLPDTYTASAKILPPPQSQSATSLLAQLSAQVVVGGAVPSLGIRNPSELYVAMLKSRTVADNLITRFDLQKIYEEKDLFSARKKLADRSTITSGREGIITIELDDKDPKRAADIANAYVEELYKLTSTLAISEASQRRLFFENQLKQTRDELSKAEVGLRQAIDTKGLAGIDVQSRAILEPSAQLRAQIALREVQLSAIRIFATDEHPDIGRLRHEIASMKRELAKLEGGDGKTQGAPTNPGGFENLRRFKDVKFLERLTELLTQQFEAAKIDEARDASIVQVLDKAIAPERRSKPKRTIIVIATALVAIIIGAIVALILEALERASSDPVRAERLQLFRRHLRWR
ncbi:MAG TPA: Wzz/FepE/Etk N-terminal domain-containing protein [Pyrinomonadaceae bacterium]|nr:Wzz/FepE/Etk N-terminal domain-containing protein [Pyrinomonadaceae bacterium]